jgi:hypothetical protein
MSARNDDDWFAAKRYGFGIGMPIAWQGWALLVGFLAAIVTLAALLAPRRPTVFAAIVITLGVAFTALAAHHTRGGLRWRWGGGDDR